jgi:hypothetical protein
MVGSNLDYKYKTRVEVTVTVANTLDYFDTVKINFPKF